MIRREGNPMANGAFCHHARGIQPWAIGADPVMLGQGLQPMETSMNRFVLTAAAVLMATAAFAAADKVKEIDVSLDIDAVTNPAAAARYANTADDLKNAIAARLVGRTDADEGVTIDINLSEVELSNTFSELVGSADTKLVGDVKVTNGPSLKNEYQLTVDVNQARVFFPENVDMSNMSASSDEYYTSMITAFADAVVVRLDQ